MKKLKKTKKNGRSDCRLCRLTSLVPNMCVNFAKRIAFTRCLFTMSPWTVSELLGSRQSKTTKPSFSPSPYITPPPFFPPAPCLRSLYSAVEGQFVSRSERRQQSSSDGVTQLRNAESRVRVYVSGRESVRKANCVLFVLIKSVSM